ncbi:MAG: hypothetical protein JWQ08_2166, partial [Deinococcus sp.]|nr:hypothetical protein [Deinococcus sp.]
KTLNNFSYNLIKDMQDRPEGHLYEETVGYVLCRKGVKNSDDWDDHEYDGYRIVLYGYFFEQGWEKQYLDGHTETLVWGYLTKENAGDVVDLISYWPGMEQVVEFLIQRFDLPPRL